MSIQEETQHHSETIKLEDATNLKQFFINGDSLCNFDVELNFSLLKKYMCKAGCNMCYLDGTWIPDNEYGVFVPGEITQQQEDNFLEMFEYFKYVSIIDDLLMLKRKYPHLYEFYKKHSHRMLLASMTDNAFLQQYDLVMDELNFKAVYDLSFSDVFLDLKSSQMADNVITKLTAMILHLPLFKIKIIITTKGERSEGVMKLIRWAKKNKIYVDSHDDFTSHKNNRYDLIELDHQQTNMESDVNVLTSVLCETVYMQFTNLYLSLDDATQYQPTPFHTIENGVNIDDIMINMLKEKIRKYKAFGECMEHKEGKFYDYYDYISSELEVNDDFNFLPSVIVKPHTQFFKHLVNSHQYINTQYGLLRAGTIGAIPLFTLDKKPKEKLEYFRIQSKS